MSRKRRTVQVLRARRSSLILPTCFAKWWYDASSYIRRVISKLIKQQIIPDDGGHVLIFSDWDILAGYFIFSFLSVYFSNHTRGIYEEGSLTVANISWVLILRRRTFRGGGSARAQPFAPQSLLRPRVLRSSKVSPLIWLARVQHTYTHSHSYVYKFNGHRVIDEDDFELNVTYICRNNWFCNFVRVLFELFTK